MASWNDFNRELQNRVSDPGLRYMLGLMYERQLDTAKQVDICSEIINQMANTMSNMVGLHEVLDGQLKSLNKHVRGTVDGVSVESESLINE